MRPKSEIYTPKQEDEHPHPFHMWSPPPRASESFGVVHLVFGECRTEQNIEWPLMEPDSLSFLIPITNHSLIKNKTQTAVINMNTLRDYGQFASTLRKESPWIFSKFKPLNTNPLWIRTLSMAPSVSLSAGFDFISNVGCFPFKLDRWRHIRNRRGRLARGCVYATSAAGPRKLWTALMPY